MMVYSACSMGDAWRLMAWSVLNREGGGRRAPLVKGEPTGALR